MPKSKGISTASRKAKGRRLQQWVAAKVRDTFPVLTERDVRSTPMGVTGSDVQLSTAAAAYFPYSVECKAGATWKPIYDAYDQATGHDGETPLLVIKADYKPRLVVMSADHFFHLIVRAYGKDHRT